METLGLQRLLAPKSVDEFLRVDFQKRPFVIQGRDPSIYAGLISLDQVEYAIDTIEPHKNECRLMGGEDPTIRRMVDQKGELRDVLVAYARGASINLTRLDRRWMSISDLRRRLLADFASQGVFLTDHGDSVVFITPPNSQALPPHVDPDDLFVLQLEGRKHWNVYGWDPFWQNGSRSQPPSPALQVELSPGDLLYVPQHWIHAAGAGTEFSFALTMGFRPLSWADLLKSLSAKLFGVAPLFHTLPTWAVAGGQLSQRGREQLIDLLRELLDTPVFRETVERLEIKDGTGTAEFGIAAANRARVLTAQTICALSGPATVDRLLDGVEITTQGRKVKGPITIEPALLWIAEQPSEFAVTDIGGALSENAKVVLARRLVLEGILQQRSESQVSP